MIRLVTWAMAAAVLALGNANHSSVVSAQASSDVWRARWAEDIEFVRREVPARHPNLFHTQSRAAWDAGLDRLVRMATEGRPHVELTTALGELLAGVGDGHTRLSWPLSAGASFFQGHAPTPPPSDPSLVLRVLPIRVAVLDDGIFVEEVAVGHRRVLAGRITAIDGMPIAAAVQRLERVIERDNQSQILDLLPSRMVIPDILAVLGITRSPDRATFTIQTREGHVVDLELEADSTTGSQMPRVSARETQPISLARRTEPFWFTHFETTNSIYFQFNEVRDGPDETFEAFTARLFDEVERRRADRLIIDLRFNHGGNSALNLSLVHGIIRSGRLRDPGRLFVLTGRGTFSAAINLAVDLERHTSAVFIGEPTGGRPNHYGDARRLILPNTGLVIRVSTLYWQLTDPRDRRTAIVPHQIIARNASDYFTGVDADLDFILAEASRRPLQLSGTWTGVFGQWFNRRTMDVVVEVANGQTRANLTLKPTGSGPVAVQSASVVERDGIVSIDWESESLQLRHEGGRLVGTARQGSTISPALFRKNQ